MDNNSFVKQVYINEHNLTKEDLIYLLFLDEKLP